MSKSLKNFLTIRDILKSYNGRQLRLLFLLHKYDTLMDFSENSFDEPLSKDKRY